MTDVVTSAYTMDLADEFGRSFALYYKRTMDADTTFSIHIEADGVAAIDVANLQWGYKTYGMAYKHNNAATTVSCTK